MTGQDRAIDSRLELGMLSRRVVDSGGHSMSISGTPRIGPLKPKIWILVQKNLDAPPVRSS